MASRTRLAVVLAALAPFATLALAGTALAEPAPGRVEVVNEAGAIVGGPITGQDGVQTAIARVRSQRANPAARWSVVIGRGTYGDFVVNEPNLTVRHAVGADVVITVGRGADVTGGGCVDITRGGLVLGGIVCRGATGNGIEANVPVGEGIAILDSRVERARGAGIVVVGTGELQIANTFVLNAGTDGIRLARLTGAGPYTIAGGAVRGSGQDGIDLADDVQRASISAVTIDANGQAGIESDDAGNTDVLIDSVVVTRNGTDGVVLGGNASRITFTNSQVAFNRRFGVNVGRGNGFVLRGLRMDGSNGQGDLRFSEDVRTGGAYDTLLFGNTQIDLPGDPVDVVVDSVTEAQRAALSPLPAGLVSVGRVVRVRDGEASAGSIVALRFALGASEVLNLRRSALAIHEDDPAGNGGAWEAMPTLIDPAGPASVTLSDAGIASGSARYATYAPLAPLNAAPAIAAVYPAPGSVIRGRNLIVGAGVGDDETLGSGAFRLTIDGRPIGGVSLTGGVVRFAAGRLSLGRHRASLLVADPSGLRTVRDWTFTIRNLRPTIVVTRARPRPGSFLLTRGLVRIRVPVRDDDLLKRLRVGVRVDGRPVRARLVRGRVVANVRLSQGRHRILVAVRDRNRGLAVRAWRFRAVRP